MIRSLIVSKAILAPGVYEKDLECLVRSVRGKEYWE
jgi:hypothetical protein